ncbi:MAG: integrase family protein [Novosphingobium lindaniclasticum]|jgi:integrase|uniref:tyrosine-type recombinase/integrase n=1 Tax=Novosphingobium lindaniclasticum TaxID=1329895 RepID=UPI00240A476F|nr:tyrosine-type recombinase/integrase [Novosphingobium lindaniclasticum]MDF2638445.1 integrase family protein [Novosphingobium lindaniclasticum]
MPRTVEEAKISTRAERKRLLPRPVPYWRAIDPDVHLGYRRGKRGGFWVVRWRDSGAYQQQALGTADDEIETGTLDFSAAVRAARAVILGVRGEGEVVDQAPDLTVRTAVEAYVAIRDARDSARKGRPTRSDASIRLGRYVLGRSGFKGRKAVPASPLASIQLQRLTEDHLVEWREALPRELKATTQQRSINDLKAALNESYAANRRRLPSTLSSVIKHGLRDQKVDDDGDYEVARENQILTDVQVSSLIDAARSVDLEFGWDGDLFRLVVVLAATGARMSQVARMRVMDVQFEASRLMVPNSRKGRGKKNKATPFTVGSDVLDVLKPVVEGRLPFDTLLERWRSKQIKGSIRWERVGRGPWLNPSELGRPWKEIRGLAGLPQVIPYALRHSSIVRGLCANQPIRLVASRHDTSVQMIERHYGRYIADVMDEVSARAVVPLVRKGMD